MTWRTAAGMEHEIERLKAEVERLRAQAIQDFERWGAEKLRLEAEVKRLKEDNEQHLVQWTRDIKKAQAEVERLRVALKEIAQHDGNRPHYCGMAAIARRALEGSE